jgi:hypothetical protein
MAQEHGRRTGEPSAGDQSQRIVFKGRLKKREKGVCQIELLDGLVVDLLEEDCEKIEESTDPVTLRAVVTVHLKGDKPITATVQPHLYRVLSNAQNVPFVFRGVANASPQDYVLGYAYVRAGGGGGSGSTHNTKMMCTNWMGTTQEDGNKPDDAGEPDEIFLP